MNSIPDAYLAELPKTDLHVHLDGSLRLPTLLDLAREQNVKLPSHSEDGLNTLVFKSHYKDLREYLAGFQYTVAVMQHAEALERVARELAEDNIAENVRYLEVRFAPQLHEHTGLDMQAVLEAVARGLRSAQSEHNRKPDVRAGADVEFHFGIIVCALRWFMPGMSSYYDRLFGVMPSAPPKAVFAAASLELARAAVRLRDDHGLPIVAFDLAGAEHGNPAGDHRDAYLHAHRHFLRKTVHAGEAYGPESIFQALTDCHADRIGHGTFLFSPERVSHPEIHDPDRYVHDLVESIAQRRICVEVNLTSNLQTLPELKEIRNHPLKKMVEHNLSATICTDNRLVSHTTVTRELRLACDHFNLSPPQLRNLVVAGFKGSFFAGDYREKRAFVRQVLNRIDALELQHLGVLSHA
jgi:adenosine deaminase